MQPPFHDGDVKQAGQPALRVGPCRPPELAEDPVLRLCPQRPRNAQHSSPLPREPHCFDPPVVVGHTFDDTITLQKVEAAGKRRLVDGQRHGARSAAGCRRTAE